MSSTSRDKLRLVGVDPRSVEGEQFVGTSAAARKLRAQLRAIAATESTVLIRGETGSGKGLVATLIHRHSRRGQRPFVHLDCTAIAASLVESELFGHERGSFTGAASRRIGRFEQAAQGTIFLDEVGDMEASLQVKLLRVLQDRKLERIGGRETISVPARVIAATNRDLESAVRDRSFREDLYYRLNVLEIRVPPLRERNADLEPLARNRVIELSQLWERPVPRITRGFFSALADYEWPGNVRELYNFLQRALVLSAGRPLDRDRAQQLMTPRLGQGAAHLRARDEPSGLTGSGPSAHERDEILAVLGATGWNVARAAKLLRIPRSTLRYRIARLGLSEPAPE
jgi:transcriptional regulator with GAF, ATPase, and Fis domain